VTSSPEQVADLLGTSGWWIREQVRRGRFEHLRVGGARIRLTSEQLEQVLEHATVARRPVAAAHMPRT